MKKVVVSLFVLLLLVLAGCASKSTTVVYDADSWKDVIADSCQSFFDGCNQCMRMSDSAEAVCTRMFCETYAEPYCTDEDVAGEVVNTDEDPATIDRETDQRAAAEQYVAQYI
jgi:hypothetical protein